MPEQHNIEYKQSWHEEHLKTVCAFANSQGGTLYIGKDDNGNATDILNYKKLMEDLPSKIKNHLGITADVNLKEENSKHFIEINVNPYTVAISLRGRYYTRTGSTTTEFTGNSLNEFLLKKSGQTWDNVIEERAAQNDIDQNSISEFLKAADKSGRLPDPDGLNTKELLEKLRLSEGDKLKRAAIILFGKDPGKFYPNVSVKIGLFGKDDADLISQEAVEGNIFQVLKDVPIILNNKFLKKKISFEGLQRIEKGEYPVAALREMLLNALVHKNYLGTTIQIRIYEDKISIWNEGSLPEGLTIEALKHQHPSIPRNPLIADVCYKGGFIDTWGRGTLKIINSCKEAGLPSPDIKEEFSGFSVTIFKDILTEEQLKKLGLNERQVKALLYLKDHKRITTSEYQIITDTSSRTAFRDLEQLTNMKLVDRIGEKKGSYYQLRNG